MKRATLLLLLASATAFAHPQPPTATDILSLRFDGIGSGVPNYTLTLHGDGSAVYQVAYPPVIPKYSPYAATMKSLPATNVTFNVPITAATTDKLFDRAVAANGFSGGCETKLKNIAKTGTKTLTYTSSAGAATCVYNYTEDKNIAALTATLQAIALTLDEGRKLEEKHRYDRLALDPETEYLVKAVKQGDATELSIIAPTLRSLIGDPQVLERVRNRASLLLEQAGTPTAP